MSEPIHVIYGKGLYLLYPSEIIANMPMELKVKALGRGKGYKRGQRFEGGKANGV